MIDKPFVNMRCYQNRTKKGNPSSAKVSKGVYYYGYGTAAENPDHIPRGIWFSRNGWERHGDVVNWAKGSAKNHQFTYTLLLTVRDGRMQDTDFIKAMEAGGLFKDWRLIVHRDTEHEHAHIVTFRDERVPKEEFTQWRELVQDYLQQAEMERLALAQEDIAAKAAEQDLELDEGWGL